MHNSLPLVRLDYIFNAARLYSHTGLALGSSLHSAMAWLHAGHQLDMTACHSALVASQLQSSSFINLNVLSLSCLLSSYYAGHF